MSIEDIDQDGQGQGQGDGTEGAGDGSESYDGDVDQSFVVSERKKPISKGTVVIFALILCAKAGIYFMYKRTGPSKADAADTKSTQVIKQFMSEKDKNAAAMKKMIEETTGIVKQFTDYPGHDQIPVSELRANPFQSEQPKNDDGSAAKNRRLEMDEAKRRELEKKAIAKAVTNLNLQSVVTSGNRRACMLNNTLYTEGQSVDAGDEVIFVIEKIEPKKVIVKSGDYKYELTMQK